MKWLILFLFLLLPTAYAYDCSIFSGITKTDCQTLSKTNESLIANLLYTSNFIPDHDFVSNYNQNIKVSSPPYGIKPTNGSYVRNAWISILTIKPSIIVNTTQYVGSPFEVRVEHSHSVLVPNQYIDNKKKDGKTCRIDYSLSSNTATLKVQTGSVSSSQKISYFVIYQTSQVEASLNVKVTINSDNYVWRYSNKKWSCKFQKSSSSSESITIYDRINLTPKTATPLTTASIGEPYLSTQRVFVNNTDRNFVLLTDNASLTEQSTYYFAQFSKPPYNFLQIYATLTNNTKFANIVRNGNRLAVPQTKTCSVTSTDYFSTDTATCVQATNESMTLVTKPIVRNNWYLIALVAVLIFIIYCIYRILKATWGKYLLTTTLLILCIPSAFASDCGLTNLGSCIPESIFNFILSIVNAPFEPLLIAINYFLTEPVSIELFFGIWQIVIYILSFFYVIMLAFAGFKFLTSGHDILKREQAKEWLKNAFLAIVFTSASFYMYQLTIEVSASVTSGTMTLVPDTFFKITIDSFSNVALEFFYSISYLLILLITLLLFSLRYILVAIGVIFAPFGVFCYFIPPLKGYGNLILQLVGVLNVIPIFCGLIALACSKMLGVGVFSDFKILLMLSAFTFMDLLIAISLWHIVNASGLKGAIDKTISAGKYIAALVA